MSERILIVRLSALGDILHALPVLAALREAKPDAHLGWLVEEPGAPLLEGHPLLNCLHVFPRRAMKENRWSALRGPVRNLLREIRDVKYDTAIDLQGLTKSAIWTQLSGAKRRIGFKGEDAREISSLFYNARQLPSPDRFHVVQRNLELLRPLGIERPEIRFPVHLPNEAKAVAKKIWNPDGAVSTHPKIVINPGAGWVTKQWPAESYGKLARALVVKLGARVALAYGPKEWPLIEVALAAAGDPKTGAQIVGGIGASPGVYPLPPTSFVELGAVIAEANLFVGGDTGPAHFAAALGIKTLSIFGASDPKRNGPWGYLDRAIQSGEPPCIPCWKTKCHWREPYACLKNVSVDRVLNAAMDILKGR